MTNSSYQDELAWIRDLVSISEQEADICFKKYSRMQAGEEKLVWIRMCFSALKRKDIALSYRAKLASWFWSSRVGAPPTP
jgi:hypothetical protein